MSPAANGSLHLTQRHGILVRAIEQSVEFSDVGRRASEDNLSRLDQKLDPVARLEVQCLADGLRDRRLAPAGQRGGGYTFKDMTLAELMIPYSK